MKRDHSASFKQSTLLPWIEIRVASQSRACYEAHSHDEFSFGIIEQGQAEYRNRSRRYQIGQGDLVTLNPADVHSCNPAAGTWSYNMLFVDTLEMGAIQRDIQQNSASDYTPFANDLERSPALTRQMRTLLDALQHDSDPLRAQTSLYQFIETSLGKGETISRSPLPASIHKVREKLFDELDNLHQLDDLASEAGMSRYQLLRAFKHHYGLPPHALVMDEKIKRAKVLLRTGLPIAQVALQLGFSDQAHFQRQFKRKLAVTPKYYQSHFVPESS